MKPRQRAISLLLVTMREAYACPTGQFETSRARPLVAGDNPSFNERPPKDRGPGSTVQDLSEGGEQLSADQMAPLQEQRASRARRQVHSLMVPIRTVIGPFSKWLILSGS